MNEIKNSLEGFKGRFEPAKEKINKLEHRPVEISHRKEKREGNFKKEVYLGTRMI